MPRPRKYSDKAIATALVEASGLVYIAAAALGCAPNTIYNRAKAVAAIAETIDNQRGKFLDTAEVKLRQALLAGEPWAIQFVLRTLGKDRGYSERFEHTGRDGGAIAFADMTDDELRSEIERLTRIVGRPVGGNGTPRNDRPAR